MDSNAKCTQWYTTNDRNPYLKRTSQIHMDCSRHWYIGHPIFIKRELDIIKMYVICYMYLSIWTTSTTRFMFVKCRPNFTQPFTFCPDLTGIWQWVHVAVGLGMLKIRKLNTSKLEWKRKGWTFCKLASALNGANIMLLSIKRFT